jgi:hypothetical protein
MLVFVDEAGDPGLKIEKGSSPFFVVGMVIFENHEEAQAADDRITLLRREMRLDPGFEFSFNRCRRQFREKFLQAVIPYEFFYYGIAINKDPAKLWGKGFQYRESFYKYACGLVFENARKFLENATVIVDGSGSKDFRNQLERYLKGRINEPQQHLIRKVKVQDSQGNNLLQLADMVVGATYRSLGQKSDAAVYRQIIAHREMYVQTWPK